ncbi:BIR7B-like protein [Mya arenaria]|uniref:BIR7B-like protein n=1 Tax=Mya arenaria TaxID=6604 RepID=A0ABY7EFJ7_MYAAR|nr:BIR7B-like protein [Mya arenaria]
MLFCSCAFASSPNLIPARQDEGFAKQQDRCSCFFRKSCQRSCFQLTAYVILNLDVLYDERKHLLSCATALPQEFILGIYHDSDTIQKIHDKDNLADTDYCHNYTHANPWKNDIKFKNPLYPPVYEVHKGGSEDKDVDFHVRCLACDRGVRHLDAGDNPWVSHRRCFPACPFARRTNGDQFIELIQASVDQGEAISELDVTIPELAEYRRKCTEDLEFSAQEFEGAFHQFGSKVLPTLEDFISCIVDNQKRNEIEGESITVDTRETTYRRPENASCEARLADAGFHFTGVGDLVRCFACDGGLRQWDAGEDPWIEHCRSFPACPFARKTKGHEFIELIQASVDQGEAISELKAYTERTLA